MERTHSFVSKGCVSPKGCPVLNSNRKKIKCNMNIWGNLCLSAAKLCFISSCVSFLKRAHTVSLCLSLPAAIYST